MDITYGHEPQLRTFVVRSTIVLCLHLLQPLFLVVMDKKSKGASFLWNPHLHHRRRSTNISTTDIEWNSWRKKIKMEQRQWLLFNPAKIKLATNDNNLVSATLALILLKIVTKKNKSILTSTWLAITPKSQKMKMQFRQERSSNAYSAKFLVLVCFVWSMIYHICNCFICRVIKWMTTVSYLTFPLWANSFFMETELCCRVLVWLMDEKRPINISTDDWCYYVYSALLPGTHETGKDDDKLCRCVPWTALVCIKFLNNVKEVSFLIAPQYESWGCNFVSNLPYQNLQICIPYHLCIPLGLRHGLIMSVWKYILGHMMKSDDKKWHSVGYGLNKAFWPPKIDAKNLVWGKYKTEEVIFKRLFSLRSLQQNVWLGAIK